MIVYLITNPSMCPLGNIVTVSITANTQSRQHILPLKMKMKIFIKKNQYSCLVFLHIQVFHIIHHVFTQVVDHIEARLAEYIYNNVTDSLN